ncbi:MAG TPA: Ldh family oxidoreductase [Methylomirabilota bacterium]|jgi:LDH2 family malate/lactate/ureidoglycolate dehydrogenase|nr:Ldh family oxidoreductase [Methylomirabilota bacterium]
MTIRVPAPKIRSQLESVFRAWGMSDEHAAITAEMMVETDLRGVDSHGISMLPTYDKEFRNGRLNMRPVWKTVREGPAMALVDADASLGHPVSVHAMTLAVDKCRKTGVAVVSVFNSHHFGAAGCYSKIAADRGVIGMVTSATRGVTMVPTFAAEPVMGTNPLAFAAPARRNPPFQLDMATTTVAAGKIKVHKLNHKPVPPGWVVDGDGKSVTDEAEAFRSVFERPEGGITPLGGTREAGSHKGYGLAVLVHILGGTLSGASFSPIRNRTQRPSDPHNIGHFFMAIDPRGFRPEGEFEDDLDEVIDVLHNAKRADPNQPVLVAGDPEMASRAERLASGVPVPDDLMTQLRAVVGAAGVPFVLAP